jgi:hypothetical protein
MTKDTKFCIIKNESTNEFFFDFKSNELKDGFILIETNLSQEQAETKTARLVDESGQKQTPNLWD